MKSRNGLLIVLAVVMAAVLACRRPPREQLSEDVKKDIAALRAEKARIDEKVRDIERARSLLDQGQREQMETLRRSLETIHNALDNIQTRLDSMEKVPPTTRTAPKHLPIGVSVVLALIAAFCITLLVRMVSQRLREEKQPQVPEATSDVGAEPSQPQSPSQSP